MLQVVRVVVALCALTLLGSAAEAQEMVDNPRYQAWAAFKPGTTITVRHEMNFGDPDAPHDILQTLVGITAEHAVLECSKTGAAASVAKDRLEIPAKVRKERVEQPWKMPPEVGEKGLLPDKNLTLGGKTYKCKVFQFVFEQNGTKTEATWWTCPEVPGEVVKLEQHLSGERNGTMRMATIAADAR